jgi:hypothetical protein
MKFLNARCMSSLLLAKRDGFRRTASSEFFCSGIDDNRAAGRPKAAQGRFVT